MMNKEYKPSKKCQELITEYYEGTSLTDAEVKTHTFILTQLDQHWQGEFRKGIGQLEGKDEIIQRCYKEIESLKKEIEDLKAKTVKWVEEEEKWGEDKQLELLREIKEIKWNSIMLDDYIENKIKELTDQA